MEITINDFVGEAEVFINQIDPEWSYAKADLFGFVSAAWPYDGTPTDAACQFRAKVEGDSFDEAVRDALGEFAGGDSNPCGGLGYYDANEDKPYRVLFSDGVYESFATAAEGIAEATKYAAESRRELRQEAEAIARENLILGCEEVE